jgi:hypothetical protein
MPSGPKNSRSPPNSTTLSGARQPRLAVTFSSTKLAMLLPVSFLILFAPKINSSLRNFLIAVIVKPTLITPAPLAGVKSVAV